MSGDINKTVAINHGTKVWMCEAIQQFTNFGYLGQSFENEVRTAFWTAGRDAVPPKIGLFWYM